jgi:hypothetical protein
MAENKCTGRKYFFGYVRMSEIDLDARVDLIYIQIPQIN